MKAIFKKMLAINLLALLIVAFTFNASVASVPNHEGNVKIVKTAKTAKVNKHRKPTTSSWSFRYYLGQNYSCTQLVNEHLGGLPSTGGPLYWSGSLGVGTIIFTNSSLTSALNAGTLFAYGPPGYSPNVFRFDVDLTGKVTSVSMCY